MRCGRRRSSADDACNAKPLAVSCAGGKAQDGPDVVEARDKALRADPPINEDALRKRLIYRSKQRGWLEVDLLQV